MLVSDRVRRERETKPSVERKQRARLREKEAPKKRKMGGHGRKNAGGMASIVAEAIERLQEKLNEEETKASVADLVRLLQLRKDLKDLQPEHVNVRWTDECRAPAIEL
jgi:oligoribonuclease NrnB/cAMP/cGMP phosphodiesterase (DHH superfamily)